MTDPNANVLWGRALVEELERSGVTATCVAPGSRSAPITLALAESNHIGTLVHLDERSAAFFALGRAKRTGEPTPLVCTSGTAAANFHPAVIEADRSRTPMLVISADRPPELQDSGANQTIDQTALYGGAVRWQRTLPEPAADDRKLRALRTTVARALAASTGTPAGPVHLNVPFAKPLEPTEILGEVPDQFSGTHPRAATGRNGPYVRTSRGRPTLDADDLAMVVSALEDAQRGLIVAGPTEGPRVSADALAALAEASGFPILADPLSGARFGPHVESAPVCGGYDAYLDERVVADWPAPEVVVRFGAAPTSTTLQDYLDRADPRAFVVDPAGGWREATFSATDLVVCDPTWLARELADRIDRSPGEWCERFVATESAYWALVTDEPTFSEGAVVAAVIEAAPDPATVFVSNSMPVRDLDRFGRPSAKALTVLGNRGASGIDGITSTALGAASTTEDPAVVITGDLAFYHDSNGLLALDRFGVEATVIEINNNGGGIFELLPVAAFDPPFTEAFKTPHGLDFAPMAELYSFAFDRVSSLGELRTAYRGALAAEGSHVIEVVSDAPQSHHVRDQLQERVCHEL